jgi:Uma2 family endonuclease
MTLAVARETGETMTPEIQPRRFTLTEFEAMSDAGFFADQHVELLDGEISVKGKQNHPHANALRRMTKKLEQLLGAHTLISAQLPMILRAPPPDFLEPDVALLKLPESQYDARDVTSEDALLVIEVSDSTLERDQTAKLRAYARNNVPEYWILNLHTQQLEVMREPSGEEYLLTRKHKVGQSVAPLEFPDVPLEWW